MGEVKKNKKQDIAEQFCQDPKYRDTMVNVIEEGCFIVHQPEEGYYKILTERDIQKTLFRYMAKEKRINKEMGKAMIKDVIYLVSMNMYRETKTLRSKYIALNDKLLNLDTLDLENFDTNKITCHKIPVDSANIDRKTPLWNKFLEDILVDAKGNFDPKLYNLVQEMFGFYLLNELDPHAVFFLYGKGANGKSILIKILTKLIGEDFTSSMSIETLTTSKFSLVHLIGKKLNVCNEEESKYIKSDKFKALVSGDLMDAEYKFGEKISFYPTAKYLFATNQIPTFNGLNHGLRRRIKILPFLRVLSDEEQDNAIFSKLETELDGILGWARVGAKRLRANNYVFSECTASAKMMTEFENEMSSAVMFVRDQYVEDVNSFITNKELYSAYGLWCENNGRKKMSSNNFQKDISGVLTLDSKVQYVPEEGKASRGRNLKMCYE